MGSKLLKLGFSLYDGLENCWHKKYDGFHLFILKTQFIKTDNQKYCANVEAFDGAIVNIPNYVSFNWVKQFDKENS